jgi:adenylate cyclase
VGAVQCAVDIQKELKTRNAELPENRRMEFRIGVNLGDVVEDGEQILGDGVNIAARLESLSEAGGVCISGTAFDQVKNKLNLGYKYLGEQTVKNILEPVRVYLVLMEPEAAGKVIGEKKAKPRQWQRATIGLVAVVIVVITAVVIWKFYSPTAPKTEVASKEKMVFPLPDKPAIAVLPFVNMSGDPQQEFFSDGLTEDLITGLSKVPNLFVIARNSTFAYKGKSVKMQQVAEELGVRYVLEGSIQKSGDRVRITAQLIDALKGHHIWSERYDREMKEFFALQDKIVLETLKAIDLKLSRGEGGRIHGKGTDNLEAYLKFLQARELLLQFNKESIVDARQLAEEVIRLDPKYPIAYHTLAVVNAQEVSFGISMSPKESLMRAIELEQKAISLDDSCASAYGFLGYLYVQIQEHEKGIAAGERANEVAPNLADAYAYFAFVLNYSGRPEEAIAHIEKAFRLNPVGPSSYYYMYAAHSYRVTGRYEDAVRMGKELLARWPNNVYGHVHQVLNYTAWGRDREAHAAAQEVLRIDPKFSAQRMARMLPYKDPALKARDLEMLRKAGLK